MSSSPVVIVQAIYVDWTKRSRGGFGAVERTQALHIGALPVLPPLHIEDNLQLHEVRYDECNHFRMPYEKMTSLSLQKPYRYDCLRLELRHDTLSVTFEWEHIYGLPRRLDYPRTEWQLTPGQWGRLIYNRRYSGDVAFYRQSSYLIACVARYSPSVFLDTPPTHEYKDIVHLF